MSSCGWPMCVSLVLTILCLGVTAAAAELRSNLAFMYIVSFSFPVIMCCYACSFYFDKVGGSEEDIESNQFERIRRTGDQANANGLAGSDIESNQNERIRRLSLSDIPRNGTRRTGDRGDGLSGADIRRASSFSDIHTNRIRRNGDHVNLSYCSDGDSINPSTSSDGLPRYKDLYPEKIKMYSKV